MPRMTLRRNDGRVQFDTTCMAFQLIGKGSVSIGARMGGNTNPGSALIPIPSVSTTRVMATRSTVAIGKAGTAFVSGQYYQHYACAANSGTVDYWIFDVADTLPPSPGGLTLRNPDTGQIIYSSDYDVFRARSKLISESQKTLDSSKLWASVQQDFAGHRQPLSENEYIINGRNEIWDGSDYPPNTTWAYRNDGKVYGTRWDGSTVFSETISWDDVIAQLNTGSYPDPYPGNWTRPLGTVLLVDVTDL